MKRLFLTFLMAATLMGIRAATLTVEMLDGQQAKQYDLGQVVKIDLTDGLRLFGADGVLLEAAAGQVAKIDFTQQPTDNTTTAVGHAKRATSGVTFLVNGETVVVKGLSSGDPVAVFAVGGQMLQRTTSNGQALSIDLSPLPAGTYVVRAGSQAAKISKR